MSKRRKNPPTREEQLAEQSIGKTDAAPPKVVPEQPASILSRTSTYHDELTALHAKTFDLVDIEDLEKRIGLRARIILEYIMSLTPEELKFHNMTFKDKADFALRAISTLEGSKQEVTWRADMAKKPRKMGVAALKKEREEVEARLRKVLERRSEVKVAVAEEALKQLQRGSSEEVH